MFHQALAGERSKQQFIKEQNVNGATVTQQRLVVFPQRATSNSCKISMAQPCTCNTLCKHNLVLQRISRHPNIKDSTHTHTHTQTQTHYRNRKLSTCRPTSQVWPWTWSRDKSLIRHFCSRAALTCWLTYWQNEGGLERSTLIYTVYNSSMSR